MASATIGKPEEENKEIEVEPAAPPPDAPPPLPPPSAELPGGTSLEFRTYGPDCGLFLLGAFAFVELWGLGLIAALIANAREGKVDIVVMCAVFFLIFKTCFVWFGTSFCMGDIPELKEHGRSMADVHALRFATPVWYTYGKAYEVHGGDMTSRTEVKGEATRFLPIGSWRDQSGPFTWRRLAKVQPRFKLVPADPDTSAAMAKLNEEVKTEMEAFPYAKKNYKEQHSSSAKGAGYFGDYYVKDGKLPFYLEPWFIAVLTFFMLGVLYKLLYKCLLPHVHITILKEVSMAADTRAPPSPQAIVQRLVELGCRDPEGTMAESNKESIRGPRSDP